MPPKVFVDTNIIVDFLMKRQPFDLAAAQFFNKADLGKVAAHVPASVFPFLFYLLSKSLPNKKEAWLAVSKFRQLVTPLSLDAKCLDLALASNFKDLEDAIQFQIAQQNSMEIILTRNLQNFKGLPIPAMTAKDFLKTI